MRLIDAEKLTELMCRQCNIERWEEPCEPDDCFIRNVILDRPTVDAVPVVRCKDCKHRGYVETCPMCWEEFQDYDENGGAWFDGITHDRTQDEYFCSRGERRTDG